VGAWRNATGRPLSSSAWLEAHHAAKLPERRKFADSLLCYSPSRIVDLGCGTGLWLDLLDEVMPRSCEFVGVDSDASSIETAQERAANWRRPTMFLTVDVESEPDRLPACDLLLAFNVLPYLPKADTLLEWLRHRGLLRRVVLRQYDGATIRLGPIPPEDRFLIDASLQAALAPSGEFHHYDMDRAFALIRQSGLRSERLDFEFTQRTAPFSCDFQAFVDATVDWTNSLLSDDARELFAQAIAGWDPSSPGGAYFVQIDLTAVLST
jgi:SAM-dependent methyltransferase